MSIRHLINKRNFLRAASRVLYAVDRSSKKDFYAYYQKYKEHYLVCQRERRAGTEFVIPVWATLVTDIEDDFINHFDHSFLKHPVIRRTMFMDYGGALQDQQLQYLESQWDKEDLKRLLKETSVGNPTITNFTYRTSHNTIHHLHHLTAFSEEMRVKLHDLKQVVEWGGGYGNLARIFLNINPHATYVMIDIPVFAFLQAVYLATIFGDRKIHLLTRVGDQIKPEYINIIPLNKNVLEQLTVTHTDLFVSTWALSESSREAQTFVESRSFFNARYLLIAHQAASEETPYAEEVANHLGSYAVTYHQKIPLLKNNYYLFAARK
ncbi:MAG: putative sugar O-methyltransferase [Patescibacteria group bacterium]